MKGSRWVATGILLMVSVWFSPRASAEPFFDLYTGKSFTRNGDVRIQQGAIGNDFTFRDVSFDDESFKTPPWYGLRAGYFFERYPWLGGAIELFHFKVLAETAESKPLQGTHNGAVVDTTARVDSIVQQFQISHGVNYLAFDVLVRHSLLQDPDRFPKGRVQLYGGVGVGPVIAHAENRIDNVRNDERYEVAGVGIQALVGVRALLFKYFGVFAEYKFTHSSLTVGVASGDAHLDENTHHLIGGITIPFPF